MGPTLLAAMLVRRDTRVMWANGHVRRSTSASRYRNVAGSVSRGVRRASASRRSSLLCRAFQARDIERRTSLRLLWVLRWRILLLRCLKIFLTYRTPLFLRWNGCSPNANNSFIGLGFTTRNFMLWCNQLGEKCNNKSSTVVCIWVCATIWAHVWPLTKDVPAIHEF